MKYVYSVCIDAGQEKVWETLADIENVKLWVEPIVESYCRSDIKEGVGTERICKLKGNLTIREEWISWKTGESFTYVGYGMPYITSATNKWSLHTEKGKTRLTSEANIVFEKGLMGRVMYLVFKLTINRMAPRTLAAFKYWVENGQPYEGKHSSLPIESAMC